MWMAGVPEEPCTAASVTKSLELWMLIDGFSFCWITQNCNTVVRVISRRVAPSSFICPRVSERFLCAVAILILEYDSVYARQRAADSVVDVQDAEAWQEAGVDTSMYRAVTNTVGATTGSQPGELLRISSRHKISDFDVGYGHMSATLERERGHWLSLVLHLLSSLTSFNEFS